MALQGLLLTTLLGTACGGDPAEPEASGGASGAGGSGGSSGDTGGAAGAGGFSGSRGGSGGTAPAELATGIETLPPNTTCVAPKTASEALPQRLSETGCMRKDDPREPAAGVIPYAVASPLWSDGADKRRFLALPPGAKITVQPSGDWDLPIGSTVIKSFAMGDTMLETRFFVRLADGSWTGYTYQWNDANTDATLLGKDGGDRFMGDLAWTFPSRANCLGCHTAAAGRTLGLETAQLNIAFLYPGNRLANQIDTLQHLGLLDPPQLDRLKLPALPNPVTATDAPVEARARSYLHANCAFCHQPAASAEVFKDMPVAMDVRFATPFRDTKLCGAEPSKTTYSIPDAKLISPGKPEASIVSVRMHSKITSVRMPAFGTAVVDTRGVAVIDEWIRGLTGCP